MNVLVTVASTHGGTADLGAAIADQLRCAGATAVEAAPSNDLLLGDPKRLTRAERAVATMVRAPARQCRDFTAARAWAQSIATELGLGAGGEEGP